MFSSDGHFVLIAEWTRLDSFGKSHIRNICVKLFLLWAKFQEMLFKDFFPIFSSGGNFVQQSGAVGKF